MSDAARNLSFSTLFNQPKILINDNQVVSVPVSVSFTPDTLLTIPTGADTTPLPPRVNVEYNNIFTSAFGAEGDTSEVLGIFVKFIISFDASQNLIIQSLSLEAMPVDVRVYWRVYRDAQPS